jgi:hypothetical protein
MAEFPDNQRKVNSYVILLRNEEQIFCTLSTPNPTLSPQWFSSTGLIISSISLSNFIIIIKERVGSKAEDSDPPLYFWKGDFFESILNNNWITMKKFRADLKGDFSSNEDSCKLNVEFHYYPVNFNNIDMSDTNSNSILT